MKDQKCVPEIVAIKKTRIVPVAVPVRSYSMPDSGKAPPSEYSSSSSSSPSPSSKKKNEEKEEEEEGGYSEEEDEEETVDGTYAEEDDDAEGYEVDDNQEGYEMDTDGYKRRFGEVQDNMTSEASAFNKKIGEMLNDKIFKQTFENPPVASNPLIDLLVSRKNQADDKYNRESNFIQNTINPLQQRIDTQIQATPHYDFQKAAIDQELK